MATVGTVATLADVAKRLDPDGKIDAVVEILAETNEVLRDMLWLEGNLPTGHRTTIRSGLPTATWRLLNYGVQPSKSRTVQVTDSCGMLEAYAQVDKALADLNGNTAAWRLSEERAFIEALNETMVYTLFYGNTETDPEKFMGLAPRFDSMSAENARNIIRGGSDDTDNTSIWLIGWGPNTVHGIYPKGSKAGLQVTDKGQETLPDGAGGYYEGYRTHFKWDCGLTVRDWRYVVRGPNIDVSELTATAPATVSTTSGANLINQMVEMYHALENTNNCKPVFYCNRKVRTYLALQVMNKSNVNLTIENFAGERVMSFLGIPVRLCDAILNTEALIS